MGNLQNYSILYLSKRSGNSPNFFVTWICNNSENMSLHCVMLFINNSNQTQRQWKGLGWSVQVVDAMVSAHLSITRLWRFNLNKITCAVWSPTADVMRWFVWWISCVMRAKLMTEVRQMEIRMLKVGYKILISLEKQYSLTYLFSLNILE